MPSNKRLWTKADYDFLRFNYDVLSVSQMADVLCRTPGSIRSRLSLWGLLLEYRSIPGYRSVSGYRVGYRVVVELCPYIRDTLPD